VPDELDTAAAVARWRRALLDWVGVPVAEVDGRVATLAAFCAATGTSPGALLGGAGRALAPVLSAAAEHGASLVVRSFLIHNGLNTFGTVVCMPGTVAQLAEQGDGWARRARHRQWPGPADAGGDGGER
jgi:hypothetical protein